MKRKKEKNSYLVGFLESYRDDIGHRTCGGSLLIILQRNIKFKKEIIKVNEL